MVDPPGARLVTGHDTAPTLAGLLTSAGVAGVLLIGWIVTVGHRLGLEELIPSRVLSRLPGF